MYIYFELILIFVVKVISVSDIGYNKLAKFELNLEEMQRDFLSNVSYNENLIDFFFVFESNHLEDQYPSMICFKAIK